MTSKTILLVLAVLGALGTCLVGGCLVSALVAAEDDAPQPVAATPGGDEPASRGGGTWQCSATGSVYQCTGPGQCMFRSVFGSGAGATQATAAEMARLACTGQAIAMGGSATCVVSCKAP